MALNIEIIAALIDFLENDTRSPLIEEIAERYGSQKLFVFADETINWLGMQHRMVKENTLEVTSKE